jgi:lambda family phage tail tape measure protein
MASSTIGSLLVALGLDTAQFEAGANKSKSIARGLSKDIESSFKSAKVAVEGLVAAFAIGALTEQIKQSLQYAAAIGETASTLGVTTKQLQEFRFAAGQVGVSQEALEGGLQRLVISIGRSKEGSEAQTKAFAALAKVAHTTVEEIRSGTGGDVFLKMADALSKVTDRTQRAAPEVALLGKNGAQLDPLLSGGVARLNALADAAHQLGVVLSEDQIANAEVTAHKLEQLKTVLEANIASTVTANANSILALAQSLSTLTSQILHFMNSHPQLALAIIGGLAGSRFGVPGAIAGVVGGIALGNEVEKNAADGNPDLQFRMQQVRNAKAALANARSSPDIGGRVIPGVGIQASAGGDKNVRAAIAELNKQTQLLNQAVAGRQSAAHGPGVNLPPFLAGNGPRGRKAPADRSDELLAQLDKEILQADQNILQAKLALFGSAEEHLQIAVDLVNLEKKIKEKGIDEEIAKAEREHAEHKITDAALAEAESKGRILKAAAEEEAAIKLRVIVEHELEQHDHDLVALSVQQLQFRQDALRTADQLATTQADHRRIQLQILDAEIEQQRLQLEANKRDAIRNGLKQEEIDKIQRDIDNLANQRAQGAAVIRNNTLNPLEAWEKQVPHTAAEINEALQSIEVKGLDGLAEAIDGVLTGTENLKDAFHSLALSVLQDLLQMTIKMLLFKALSSVLGGLGGGGGADLSGGMDFSGSFGAITGSPGFASGGSIMVGGRSGTDRNVLALNGLPIARVSYGERINIANDDTPMGGPSVALTMHNDFRGVDPASVARVEAQLNQMQAEFPQRVVSAWADANNRFVFKAQRR